MNKEFIPYEQALALKELGFDENCLSHYVKGHEYKDWTLYFEGGTFFAKDYPEFISAPLYQQAFRWFRDNYGLRYEITYCGFYHIFIQKRISAKKYYLTNYTTYEQAELACLKKLIEIVKNGN